MLPALTDGAMLRHLANASGRCARLRLYSLEPTGLCRSWSMKAIEAGPYKFSTGAHRARNCLSKPFALQISDRQLETRGIVER